MAERIVTKLASAFLAGLLLTAAGPAHGGSATERAQIRRDMAAESSWDTARAKTMVSAPLFPEATTVRVFASKEIIRVADNGALQSDAYPGSGEILTPREVALLRKSVFHATAPWVYIACCAPRHAFLFYDKAGKFLGYLTVCYECGCADIKPDTPPSPEKRYVEWDGGRIARILRAHKIPTRFYPPQP